MGAVEPQKEICSAKHSCVCILVVRVWVMKKDIATGKVHRRRMACMYERMLSL